MNKSQIDQIKSIAKIEDVADDFMQLKKSGKDLETQCPFCQKPNGFKIIASKQIYKCFSCGEGGGSALKYLQHVQKMSYPEALEYLSKKYNIDTTKEDDRKARLEHESKKSQERKTNRSKKSFLEKQLKGSGLSFDDVRATILDESKKRELSPFQVGCRNDYWQLVPGEGDDMVIFYYDLDGKPITYIPKKRKYPEQFFRIRFQFPDQNKDRNGKSMKYYSPAGSGTQLYIPEAIRRLYKAGRDIKRLYLQEGEKKAEKACKHGIPSVGLMGIHNVGSDNVMPRDLYKLIQACNIQEVCLVFDSDWQDISKNIHVGDNVQLRPYSFFRALKNYKDYMLSFRNSGINLEVYFAAINNNEAKDKGLDDLLVNSLGNEPGKLQSDIEHAINAKDGLGEFIQMHKITALTDYQLKNFWHLNSNAEFAKRHLDELKDIPEFTIYKTKYRINEADELELAEPLLPEEKYWERLKDNRYTFKWLRAYRFLKNRGFGRITMLGTRYFVRVQNNIVEFVDRVDIKDYVMNVTKDVADEAVCDMMFRGGSQYLGPQSLENIDMVDLQFEMAEKESQNLHFKDKFWHITKDKITELDPSSRKFAVWGKKIHPHKTKLLDPLVHFSKDENGDYSYRLSKDGKNAHFLQFLINTCNFYWTTSRIPEQLGEDQQTDIAVHLISKMTAFGYMCHRFFNANVAKAVVAMDGKNSEVGASNGRSGKSLFGMAVGRVIPQVYIGGKSKRLTEDPFLFEEVTDETENVFIDDIRANIDFEFFFPPITGRWTINKKGIGRNTLKSENSPKLYFSTNHAINGEGSSFSDRQHILAFSDFYNNDHKPPDDFGLLFFDEWDETQWNYFFNFVALSLQLYFQHGLVPAPLEGIEKRRLRQLMGEDFLQWADILFTRDELGNSSQLNQELVRTELYNQFIAENPRAQRYMTPTRFGKCMRAFCEYKGYAFNPGKPNKSGQIIDDFLRANPSGVFIGEVNKKGGTEYWEISDAHLDLAKPF